jgi:hypothetical protein
MVGFAEYDNEGNFSLTTRICRNIRTILYSSVPRICRNIRTKLYSSVNYAFSENSRPRAANT